MAGAVHRLLIVDDDPAIRELSTLSLAAARDIEVVGEACNGMEAVDRVEQLAPDVVLMDVEMPLMDGPTATERIVRRFPGVKVLAYTGYTGGDVVLGMIVAGAVGYVVKGADPFRLADAIRGAAAHHEHLDPKVLPGLFGRLVEMTREERERRYQVEQLAGLLEHLLDDTIRSLAQALHSRDGYTGDHDDRVGTLAMCVGDRLGVQGADLRDLRYGGILHDVGKIGVPDHILHKTSELTDEEWELIKMHTIFGEEIIRPLGFLDGAATIVRHSHEHWDGSGYPDGLERDEIPFGSRIVLACDAFDAITSERTYQRARSEPEAVRILRELRGVHFDPEVVRALEGVLDEGVDRARPRKVPRLLDSALFS